MTYKNSVGESNREKIKKKQLSQKTNSDSCQVGQHRKKYFVCDN